MLAADARNECSNSAPASARNPCPAGIGAGGGEQGAAGGVLGSNRAGDTLWTEGLPPPRRGNLRSAGGHGLRPSHNGGKRFARKGAAKTVCAGAVEQGNRRLRKVQKTVYRVRKRETLRGRLALDLQREQQATGRDQTLTSLHQARG